MIYPTDGASRGGRSRIACRRRIRLADQRLLTPSRRQCEGAIRTGLAIRLVIWLMVFIGMVQVLRPAQLGGQVGTLEDARRMAERVSRLMEGQETGEYVREEVSEPELNAYLSVLLYDRGRSLAESRIREGQDRFRIQFEPGEIRAVWASFAGPLRITYEIRGAPARREQDWHFETRSVHAGRLPLPGRLGQWVANKLFRTLATLQREEELYRQASSIEITDGAVAVGVGDRP